MVAGAMTETSIACPCCRGTEWEDVVDAQGVARVRRCVCWEEKHQIAPGVPLWCREARLATLPNSSVNAAVRRQIAAWLEEPLTPRPDVYLFGPTGTGKTTLAATLANELEQRQVRTYFVGVRAFIHTLLEAVGVEDPERKQAAQAHARRVREVEVLVFDDVAGGEKNSDFSRATLTGVLDDRLAAGHTTIWTSNMNLEQLAAFFGDDRLPSRIAGACGPHLYEFRGDDHRLGSRRRFGLFRGGTR